MTEIVPNMRKVTLRMRRAVCEITALKTQMETTEATTRLCVTIAWYLRCR